MSKISPVHPGEILYEESLEPLGISQNELGNDLDVAEDVLAARIKKEVRQLNVA